jgi:SSS family solute:Na+ symporter
LAISSISGLDITLCMIFLSIFCSNDLHYGMKVIGYTDVILFFLILGGLVTTYLALNLVAKEFGSSGVINGFNLMTTQANDHFT